MSVLDVSRQRSAFTDALRPPSGYVLGACIGTTFSLDFEIFTAVLLAFVGADVEEPTASAPAVLTTVARLKSRLRVFVNGGSLQPPATSNRLFALYDRLLRPQSIAHGAFHPKVWVVRFDPTARPERHPVEPIYRLLIASRNVTNSGCWELGALFEGTRGTATQKFGSDVAGFFRRVADAPELPKALRNLIAELRYVQFSAPREAADSLRFDWQWPGERVLVDRLPKNISRALLISPFLRAEFLKTLCARTTQLTVVSTQSELDQLSDSIHEMLSRAGVFVVVSDTDEGSPSLDLHAKLLAFEADGIRETLIGSANATGPGWGCSTNVNCEAMVSLRPGLGIDAVVKAFVAPSKDQLQPWIEDYVRQPAEVDTELTAAKLLERFKRQLCTDVIRGVYDPVTTTLRLTSSASSSEQLWPTGMCAKIIPLLQRDQTEPMDYQLLYGPGASFEGVDLGDVAAFAYVVAWNEKYPDDELRFVVQFELDLGSLEEDERDRAVNARLLEGVDARSLLLDVLAGRPGGTTWITAGGEPGGWQAGEQLLKRATIERILETCTADPSRIYEVNAVLSACSDMPNMNTFMEFWAALRDSLKEELAGV